MTKDDKRLAFKALGDVIKKRIDAQFEAKPAVEKRIEVRVEAPPVHVEAPTVNVAAPVVNVAAPNVESPSVAVSFDIESLVKSINNTTKTLAECAKSSGDSYEDARIEMKGLVQSLTEAVGVLAGSMSIAIGSVIEEMANLRKAMVREKRKMTITHDDGTSSTISEE